MALTSVSHGHGLAALGPLFPGAHIRKTHFIPNLPARNAIGTTPIMVPMAVAENSQLFCDAEYA